MRFNVLLNFIFFIHVNASYIDKFQGALYNVERSFENLLSDVVTDMKGTIDCTISAVEHVLYVNGIYNKPSSYYSRRCNYDTTPAPTYKKINPENDKLAHLINKTTFSDVDQNGSGSQKDAIFEQLQSSISNVNKTLFNIINDNETTEKIQSISESLRNETTYLTKVSNMLRTELERVYKNINNRIPKLNLNNDSSTDSILNDIKMLEDMENNSRNISEVQEIHDVFAETLHTIQNNENGHEDKIDKVIKELKKGLSYDQPSLTSANIHISDSVDALKGLRESIDETGITGTRNVRKSDNGNESEALDSSHSDVTQDVTESEQEVIAQANKIIEESRFADRLLAST